MDAVRNLRALVALVVVLGLVVITGSDSWSGPVLMTLTATHGVHLADLSVVGLAAVVALYALAQVRPAVSG